MFEFLRYKVLLAAKRCERRRLLDLIMIVSNQSKTMIPLVKNSCCCFRRSIEVNEMMKCAAMGTRTLQVAMFVLFAILPWGANAKSKEKGNVSNCVVDEQYRQAELRLRLRGYSSAVISQSCMEVLRWAPENRSRWEDNTILVSLGVDHDFRRHFLRKDRSVGEYLIKDYKRSQGRTIAGILTIIAGMGLTIGGAAIWVHNELSDSSDLNYDDTTGWSTSERADAATSLIMMIGGAGVAIPIGTLLALLGYSGTKRFRLPDELSRDRDPSHWERWYRESYAPENENKRLSFDVKWRTGGAELGMTMSF